MVFQQHIKETTGCSLTEAKLTFMATNRTETSLLVYRDDIEVLYCSDVHCAKKNNIYQVTTMLATSKKSYFQVITTC